MVGVVSWGGLNVRPQALLDGGDSVAGRSDPLELLCSKRIVGTELLVIWRTLRVQHNPNRIASRVWHTHDVILALVDELKIGQRPMPVARENNLHDRPLVLVRRRLAAIAGARAATVEPRDRNGQKRQSEKHARDGGSCERLHHLTSYRRRTIRARENFSVHGQESHFARREEVERIEGMMPRPKAHYSLVVKNHSTGKQLRVELVDLPFSENRRFRLRVNGQWARKLPVASKSVVLHQVRSWLVKQ